jgi:hypothetical protein
MPLFYHMERLQPPHKVRMSPFFMLKHMSSFHIREELSPNVRMIPIYTVKKQSLAHATTFIPSLKCLVREVIRNAFRNDEETGVWYDTLMEDKHDYSP